MPQFPQYPQQGQYPAQQPQYPIRQGAHPQGIPNGTPQINPAYQISPVIQQFPNFRHLSPPPINAAVNFMKAFFHTPLVQVIDDEPIQFIHVCRMRAPIDNPFVALRQQQVTMPLNPVSQYVIIVYFCERCHEVIMSNSYRSNQAF